MKEKSNDLSLIKLFTYFKDLGISELKHLSNYKINQMRLYE